MTPPEEDEFGKPVPAGTQLRTIRDGLSKTICIVEASDEMAVIWTKPDDFQPETDAPAKGLVGLRPGIFLSGYCDGHVQVISETVDRDVLSGLFTKDGGEVVQAP